MIKMLNQQEVSNSRILITMVNIKVFVQGRIKNKEEIEEISILFKILTNKIINLKVTELYLIKLLTPNHKTI